jgi:UDP-N-acetyl-D-mannosaminuronic acid dehydrogenase
VQGFGGNELGETTSHNKLFEMIKKTEAKIVVMGLGYVGLPTAALFANLGFRVIGVDVNPKIVSQINEGKLQTDEKGLHDLVSKTHKDGRLCATTAPSEALTDADIVIVCVQTPLDKKRHADLSFLRRACEEIAQALKRDKLVVIQSTVPPTSILTMVVPILEERSGLKCGTDFWLTYCPERMAPGNGLHDLTTNTRLIGAFDSESAILGDALYRIAANGEILITDIQSAEVSKLAENAFRYVNIAFANELALICRQIGVDANDVIRLANTHPRVNILQPSCGVGGPCLSKDTHLLFNSAHLSNYKAAVLPAAIRLNNSMPTVVAEFATAALKRTGKNIATSKIAVFGTAYKGGVTDSRNSPAGSIISKLKKKQASIVVFDPHCDESFGAQKVGSLLEAVEGADCIIIATDHEEFRKIDLAKIRKKMNKNPIIVDGKRVVSSAIARDLGFEYIAISFASEKKSMFAGEP